MGGRTIHFRAASSSRCPLRVQWRNRAVQPPSTIVDDTATVWRYDGRRRSTMTLRAALAIAIGMMACNGAGDDGAPGDVDASNPDRPDAAQSVDAATSTAGTTVFTIVLENHDYNEIVGSPNAPYINSLIAQYGLAANYKETGNPSLPNYLNMIS